MLTRVLRIILVILSEHPSNTYVFTVKMEILLEPTSNKLSVDVLVLRTSKYGESNAYGLEDLTLELETPSRRYKRRCCSLIPAESDSLTHAHTQPTKTYYKHQDSRIKKAQELNSKTSANSNIQDLPKSYQD
ncbi:hypothetical protein Tco_0968347 [Tanacetum coccineum]